MILMSTANISQHPKFPAKKTVEFFDTRLSLNIFCILSCYILNLL